MPTALASGPAQQLLEGRGLQVTNAISPAMIIDFPVILLRADVWWFVGHWHCDSGWSPGYFGLLLLHGQNAHDFPLDLIRMLTVAWSSIWIQAWIGHFDCKGEGGLCHLAADTCVSAPAVGDVLGECPGSAL